MAIQKTSTAPKTFEAFVEEEKSRLDALKQDAQNRLEAVQEEIAAVDKELAAITAYVSVKEGKSPVRAAPAVRTPRQSNGKRAPRGSRQRELIDVIKKHPDGIGRAEILQALGLKGKKSGEQSVSNALNTMKKAGKIGAHEGRYVIP